MAKGKNHIDPIKELSLEQMQAYTEGKLSPAEQYQVEKYLLDHPFEAEAMEGYLENPTAFDDLGYLKAKLDSRTKPEDQKRIIPLWKRVLPYAAVFLLLIISTVFTINYFQQDDSFVPISIESDDALQFEKNDSPINLPLAIRPDTVEKKSENQSMEIVQNIDAEDKETPALVAERERSEEPLLPKEPISPDEDLLVSESTDMEEVLLEDSFVGELQGKVAGVEIQKTKSQTKKAERTALVAPAEEAMVNNELRSGKKQSTVRGVVLDSETGEPLPGVNVLLRGTTIGVNTGLEGNFEIAAGEGDVLIVSFIGMEKQEYSISDRDDIEIFLNADVTQLSEVVVTGYGSEKEEDLSYTATKPRIGFSAYKDYLKENLQYPQEAKEEGTEGRVRLKLTINASGDIKDIEVLKSLGDGCDEEAIRLVREGPKWQAAKKGDNNVPSTRKITVRFKLD